MPCLLIVDDEPDVVAYLADELALAGYTSVGASDGVEAILHLLDHPVDLVLMDIRMPRLDGINALRLMRRLRPELPIITFTGQAGQGDMAASTQLGAFTCLLKPISSDKLLRTIRAALHPLE
jgi:two-component system response regulator AtoC